MAHPFSSLAKLAIKVVPIICFLSVVDASLYMLEGLMVLGLIYLSLFFPVRLSQMHPGSTESTGEQPEENENRGEIKLACLPLMGLLIFGLQVYQSPLQRESLEQWMSCKNEQFAQVEKITETSEESQANRKITVTLKRCCI